MLQEIASTLKDIMDSGIHISYGRILGGDDAPEMFTLDAYFSGMRSPVIISNKSVYAAILLMPSLIPVVAKMALTVKGRNSCFYVPPRPGDQVIVLVPEGSLDSPLVFIHAPNNDVEPLHESVISNPDQALIHLNDGIPLNVNVNGAEISIDTAGVVRINGDEAAIKGDTLVSLLGQLITVFNTHVHSVTGVQPGSGAIATLVPVTPIVDQFATAKSSTVKVG